MGRITCITSLEWVIIGVIVANVLVTGSATGSATLSVTVVDTTESAAVDDAAASIAA